MILPDADGVLIIVSLVFRAKISLQRRNALVGLKYPVLFSPATKNVVNTPPKPSFRAPRRIFQINGWIDAAPITPMRSRFESNAVTTLISSVTTGTTGAYSGSSSCSSLRATITRYSCKLAPLEVNRALSNIR